MSVDRKKVPEDYTVVGRPNWTPFLSEFLIGLGVALRVKHKNGSYKDFSKKINLVNRVVFDVNEDKNSNITPFERMTWFVVLGNRKKLSEIK